VLLGGHRHRASGGHKNLIGGPGNDIVCDGLGSDDVVGNEGNDYMCDGDASVVRQDALSEGWGNDVLLVGPSAGDVVACGDGFDRFSPIAKTWWRPTARGCSSTLLSKISWPPSRKASGRGCPPSSVAKTEPAPSSKEEGKGRAEMPWDFDPSLRRYSPECV
jgi:hypothetical protein